MRSGICAVAGKIAGKTGRSADGPSSDVRMTGKHCRRDKARHDLSLLSL